MLFSIKTALAQPCLTGTRGLGGYQLISATNDYLPIPGGTSNYSGQEPVTTIQSGKAFFVHATGTQSGGVAFSESTKSSGSSMVYRNNTNRSASGLRCFLYTVSGRLADGCSVQFSAIGNNGVDGREALKIKNPGENLSVMTNGVECTLEERFMMLPADSVQFSISGLLRQSYELRLVGWGIQQPGFNLVMLDRFLQTEHVLPLSDTVYVPFTVTSDPLSWRTNRFVLYWKPMATLSIQSMSLLARSLDERHNLLEWVVRGESYPTQYIVESSNDGRQFSYIARIFSNMNSSNEKKYSFIDTIKQASSIAYYRITAIEYVQNVTKSNIVRIAPRQFGTGHSIDVFRSADLSSLILRFSNMPATTYFVSFFSETGHFLHREQLRTWHAVDQKQISCPRYPGILILKITDSEGNSFNKICK